MVINIYNYYIHKFYNSLVINITNIFECLLIFPLIYNFVGHSSNASKLDEDDHDNTNDDKEITNLEDLQSSLTFLIRQQQQNDQQTLNSMTLDHFSSPILNSSSSPDHNSLENNISHSITTRNHSENVVEPNVENLIDFQQSSKGNFASGGSSPSREVQEILAHNNPTYNPQQYYDNLNKISDDVPDGSTEKNFTDSAKNLMESENTTWLCDPKVSDISWPNIPTAKALEIQLKEENRRKELQDENVNKLDMSQIETLEYRIECDMSRIKTLEYRIESLENLVQEQNMLLKKLSQDINSQLHNEDYNICSKLSNELELIMSRNQSDLIKLLDATLKDYKCKDVEQLNAIIIDMKQVINENLREMISHEIQSNVLPHVLEIFEKLQAQLDIRQTQKINTIDQTLKASITKFLNSKVS